MRKKYTQDISEVVKEYLKAMHIDGKIKEVNIMSSWEEVMGGKIAKYTQSLRIYNRVLFVTLSSSVARHELQMLKQGIIIALNDRAGEKVIDDIVFK
jgi:predicted nucleic acid-binding Zn ribbon protein